MAFWSDDNPIASEIAELISLNVEGAVSKFERYKDVPAEQILDLVKKEMPKMAKVGEAWLTPINMKSPSDNKFFALHFLTPDGVKTYIGNIESEYGYENPTPKFEIYDLSDKDKIQNSYAQGRTSVNMPRCLVIGENGENLEECINLLRIQESDLARLPPTEQQVAMEFNFALENVSLPPSKRKKIILPGLDSKSASEMDPVELVVLLIKRYQASKNERRVESKQQSEKSMVHTAPLEQGALPMPYNLSYSHRSRLISHSAMVANNPRLTQILFNYGMVITSTDIITARIHFQSEFPREDQLSHTVLSEDDFDQQLARFENYQLFLTKDLETQLKENTDFSFTIHYMLEAIRYRSKYLTALNKNPESDLALQGLKKIVTNTIIVNKNKIVSSDLYENIMASVLEMEDLALYKVLTTEVPPYRQLNPDAFYKATHNLTSGACKCTSVEEFVVRRHPEMIPHIFKSDNINKPISENQVSPLVLALQIDNFKSVLNLLQIPNSDLYQKVVEDQTVIDIVGSRFKNSKDIYRELGDDLHKASIEALVQAKLREMDSVTALNEDINSKKSAEEIQLDMENRIKEIVKIALTADFDDPRYQITTRGVTSGLNCKNAVHAKNYVLWAALKALIQIKLRTAPDLADMSFRPETEKPEELGIAQKGQAAPGSEQKDRKEAQDVLFQAQMEKEIKGRQPFIEALKHYKGEKAILQAEPFSEARRQKIEQDIPETILWLSLDPSVNQASLNSFYISYKLPDMPAQHLEASLSSSGYTVTLPDQAKTVVTEKDIETFLDRVSKNLFSPSIKPPVSS